MSLAIFSPGFKKREKKHKHKTHKKTQKKTKKLTKQKHFFFLNRPFPFPALSLSRIILLSGIKVCLRLASFINTTKKRINVVWLGFYVSLTY
jgi:hypothetical protein